MKLLSFENAKTPKGEARGYLTAIMYLAPSNESGVVNTCPRASKGCKAACLYKAGRGVMRPVQTARVNRTLLYHANPDLFVKKLKEEINAAINKSKRLNMTPCIRLNGTSDIAWEETVYNVIQSYPDVQFYDYTKRPERFETLLPANYHLTFSLSESNEKHARRVLELGGNVAVVFRNELPKTFWGYKVVNGDETDLRFLDSKGVIVGLKAKGKARKDVSGFVKESC